MFPEKIGPAAPFEPLLVHGESITIPTAGKILVLPTGNIDLLPGNNEYTLNPQIATLSELPLGGVKSTIPDLSVGTVNIISGDGVYLQDLSGTNSAKTLGAGKLKELGLLSFDTAAHSFTEEFIVANTATSNNPTVIDACDSVTNWTATRGALSNETTDKQEGGGCLKLTASAADSYAQFTLNSNLSSQYFISVWVKATSGKTIQCYITSSATYTNYYRYELIANGSWQKWVIPIKKPSNSYGTPDFSSIVRVRFGLPNSVSGDVLLFDNITADTYKSAYIELQTPDNLAATSTQIYAHNGTAYQLCRTDSLDGAYANISATTANCTMLDGTKFDDVYGSGLGRAVFPKGGAGETKAGSSGNITYSANKGTQKRIGFRVDLPPSDGGRTNFNKIGLKVVTYYSDKNKATDILPDLSGNGNHGVMSMVGLTADNAGNPYGAMKFDGVNSGVTLGNILDLNSFSVIIKLCPTSTGSSYDNLIQKKGALSGDAGYSIHRYDTYNYPRVLLGNGTTSDSCTFNDLNVWGNLNTWQDLAFIIDFSNRTVKAYKNGVASTYTRSITVDTFSSNNILKINNNFRYNGLIREIRFYSRILSPVEILAYTNGQPISSEGLVASWSPKTVSHMGSTTKEFSGDSSASTGLQHIIKPFLVVFDPAKSIADFYLFTHKLKNLEIRRDETGQIYEIVLHPGNGVIYHGQITYPDLTLDSDSDLIPNFLEENIEGSLTKFLKCYGMVTQ